MQSLKKHGAFSLVLGNEMIPCTIGAGILPRTSERHRTLTQPGEFRMPEHCGKRVADPIQKVEFLAPLQNLWAQPGVFILLTVEPAA